MLNFYLPALYKQLRYLVTTGSNSHLPTNNYIDKNPSIGPNIFFSSPESCDDVAPLGCGKLLMIASAKIGVIAIAGVIGYFYCRRHDESKVSEAASDVLNNGPPGNICPICFEETENKKVFINQVCSHSFCWDCTTKYIETKLQENADTILCPGVNCKTSLDLTLCRQILPNHVRTKWDEYLCMSLIPVSQRIYCPFSDCSVMLVNDSGKIITKSKCPACRRLICATCRVPWHLEFNCQEFKTLDAKTKGKDEEFFKELAKKKRWRQCPSCEIYVEKTQGCLHITCRCWFEFCYKCGKKWGKACSGGC